MKEWSFSAKLCHFGWFCAFGQWRLFVVRREIEDVVNPAGRGCYGDTEPRRVVFEPSANGGGL
jgi:hypothetical protein